MIIKVLQIFLAIFGIGILVIVHEFGHFITSKLFNIKVLEFMLGLPGPKLFSFQRGETTYGVTAIPFGGYVKTIGSDPYEELTEEEKKRSLEHAPILKKSAVVLAGPSMNFIVAIILLTLILKTIGMPVYSVANTIAETKKNYPASNSGIVPGDKIIKIDGKNIRNGKELIETVSAKPNKVVTLVVKHKSKTRTIKLKTKSVRDDNGKIKGIIGIILTESLKGYKPLTFISSIKQSFLFLWIVVSKTATVIFNAVTGKPQFLLKSGRGIIGIVTEASVIIVSIFNYLFLVAYLNVAIGFVNLLPIPPLDGGKIILYIVELIKGGHLKKKTLIAINAVGIALMLTAFVYFTVKDVTRIIMSVYPKM